MAKIEKLYQTDDWKNEKHVPVIELPEEMESGEPIRGSVTVGKEIPHPNTTAHHIDRMEVLFLPEEGKFPYRLGTHYFAAHGASTEGADTSGVYENPYVEFEFVIEESGTIIANSYCNIHGLWTNEVKLELK